MTHSHTWTPTADPHSASGATGTLPNPHLEWLPPYVHVLPDALEYDLYLSCVIPSAPPFILLLAPERYYREGGIRGVDKHRKRVDGKGKDR